MIVGGCTCGSCKSCKFNAYLDLSYDIEQKFISSMGKEAYEASQHWVNNPLISDISKVYIFNKSMARAWEEGYRAHITRIGINENPYKGGGK